MKTTVEKLLELKEKAGITNAMIAEESKIPESTVARVLSGRTMNPSADTYSAIESVLQGHLPKDDSPKCEMEPICSRNDCAVAKMFDRIIEEKDEQLTILKKREAYLSRWIRTLAVVLFVLFAVYFAFFVIDAMNPNVGFLPWRN